MMKSLVLALSLGSASAFSAPSSVKKPAPTKSSALPSTLGALASTTAAAMAFAAMGVAQAPLDNPNLLSAKLPEDLVYYHAMEAINTANFFGLAILPAAFFIALHAYGERASVGAADWSWSAGMSAEERAKMVLNLEQGDDMEAAEWEDLLRNGAFNLEGDMACVEVFRDGQPQWLCV